MTSLPHNPQPPILAVDWGTRRIGIAVSPDGKNSFPRPHLEIISKTEALESLKKIIHDEQVKTVILGLPLSLDSTEGDMAKNVRQLGMTLEAATGIPIVYVDERMTSKLSSRIAPGSVKGRSDSIAAMLLLEYALGR